MVVVRTSQIKTKKRSLVTAAEGSTSAAPTTRMQRNRIRIRKITGEWVAADTKIKRNEVLGREAIRIALASGLEAEEEASPEKNGEGMASPERNGEGVASRGKNPVGNPVGEQARINTVPAHGFPHQSHHGGHSGAVIHGKVALPKRR